MPTTINDRFREYMERNKLNIYRVSVNCDLNQTTVRNIVLGRNGLTADTLARLLATYPDLDARWLILGDDPTQYQAPPRELKQRGRPRKETAPAGLVAGDGNILYFSGLWM